MNDDKKRIADESAATYGAASSNLEQTGVDSFMDFSAEDDMAGSVNEDSNSYNPGVKYAQKSMNMLAEKTGGSPLKEDGIAGPKTMAATQGMLKNLPPELKKYAVNALYKAFNSQEGVAGGGGVEDFRPDPSNAASGLGENMQGFSQDVADKKTPY